MRLTADKKLQKKEEISIHDGTAMLTIQNETQGEKKKTEK